MLLLSGRATKPRRDLSVQREECNKYRKSAAEVRKEDNNNLSNSNSAKMNNSRVPPPPQKMYEHLVRSWVVRSYRVGRKVVTMFSPPERPHRRPLRHEEGPDRLHLQPLLRHRDHRRGKGYRVSKRKALKMGPYGRGIPWHKPQLLVIKFKHFRPLPVESTKHQLDLMMKSAISSNIDRERRDSDHNILMAGDSPEEYMSPIVSVA